MEITLEKIELVKDRTGVTYKESKEALEATEGNVVDAIIMLEETVNQKKSNKAIDKGEELMAKIKEIVGKGNVSRIKVKRDDEVILNLPLNAGIVGTIVAPWGMIAGVAAAVGFKCVVEFVKEDGSSIDLSEKAGKYYEVVKEKGGEVYDDLKTKGADKFDDIKEKAPGVYDDLKAKGADTLDDLRERGNDLYAKAKDMVNEKRSKVTDDLDEFVVDVKDELEDIENDIREELDKK